MHCNMVGLKTNCISRWKPSPSINSEFSEMTNAVCHRILLDAFKDWKVWKHWLNKVEDCKMLAWTCHTLESETPTATLFIVDFLNGALDRGRYATSEKLNLFEAISGQWKREELRVNMICPVLVSMSTSDRLFRRSDFRRSGKISI
jgi:hypothetical protein